MAEIEQRKLSMHEIKEMIGTEKLKEIADLGEYIRGLDNSFASIVATELFVETATNNKSTQLNMCTNVFIKTLHRHFKGNRKVLQTCLEGVMQALGEMEKLGDDHNDLLD